MIAAENNQGISGYIYYDDYNADANSLEEAAEWMETHSNNYTIPLYDEDGITVIGQFEITVTDCILIE